MGTLVLCRSQQSDGRESTVVAYSPVNCRFKSTSGFGDDFNIPSNHNNDNSNFVLYTCFLLFTTSRPLPEPSRWSTKDSVETMALSSQRRASAGAAIRLLAIFAMLASMFSIAYISGRLNPIAGLDESPRSLLLTSKAQPNHDLSYVSTENLRTITPFPSSSRNRLIEVLVDDELKVRDSSSDFDSQLDLDDQFFSD
jgi:hypothetical protein